MHVNSQPLKAKITLTELGTGAQFLACFMSSSANYLKDGVGQVPNDAQLVDVVYILRGANLPYWFPGVFDNKISPTKDGGNSHGRFCLVNPCFVYGIVSCEVHTTSNERGRLPSALEMKPSENGTGAFFFSHVNATYINTTYCTQYVSVQQEKHR